MIKRILKWCVIVISMSAIIITCTIKAYAEEEEKTNFASVTSNEAIPGSNVDITLDLKNIAYDTYTIKLTSDSDINTPSVTTTDTGSQVGDISEDSDQNSIDNVITNSTIESDNTVAQNTTNEIDDDTTNSDTSKEFTISNVSNLDNIIISVTIPEDSQIGSKITFTITITDANNSNNMLSTQITINVVEKLSNDQSDNISTNNDQQSASDSQKQTTLTSMTSSALTTTTQSTSTTQQTTTQTVTYDGSDDNYLTDIKIDGESVSNFNKTNTTYFKTLEAETTSTDISYTLSDSAATVCVYGNTDLKSGLNKILITVTAENGNVRYYRVYVTVKS